MAKRPVHTIVLRVPLTQYAELVTLNPDMRDGQGFTRYGSIPRYFLGLMQKDLEERKKQLRESANAPARITSERP